ncbi:MAG: hypothetical protein IPM39_13470 [Chloroflexi bacterium]|nr:hypothetical protein [Chloroflexota bacterium]
MTLSQQFLIVAILPLTLLGMVVYLWVRGSKRRHVLYRWTLTLLATAVWASSMLRFYGGSYFPPILVFNWGIVGSYAFTLAAFGVLLTTLRYMFVANRPGKAALGVSGCLWLAAVGLDANISPGALPAIYLGTQTIRPFDIWAAVWIASWVIPVLASWMFTHQVNTTLPISLYRNQIRYWLLVLGLFAIGGCLTSIHQPGQPIWQEMGVLVVILAALVGTISLTHGQMPDLQVAARQLIYRLSGTVTVFALVWLALTFILRIVTNLPATTDPNLILILAAAVFAALLMVVYRLVNGLARRLFLPSASRREAALVEYAQAVGYFPEPEPLGHLFLQALQATLGVDEAWLFMADEGPQGILVLRPLTATPPMEPELETADFAADSPFTSHLRQQKTPLIQYDMDVLDKFHLLPTREKELLARWQRVLYMPLTNGSNLEAVVALGGKRSGEPYDRQDYAELSTLCAQASPLLAQARHMETLRRINESVLYANQTLARQNRHLQESVTLYSHYIDLVSPELRRPFTTIHSRLLKLQESGPAEPIPQPLVASLSQEFANLRQPIETLINLAARVQSRRGFDFQLVHLPEITRRVIRNLDTMAEARRVTIEFEPDRNLPLVLGDAEQLQEAIHNLIHNAIKFNKIGGRVHLNMDIDGSDLYLQIADTGVGIPPERMESIWNGLTAVNTNGSSKKRPSLGLTLAHFIVAAHGGRVQASSQYGTGSTFTIYLPLVFAEE